MSDSLMTNITSANGSAKTLKTATTGKSTLDVDDFYKLMAAQLQNQDMTNPTDQSQFINQMTQMAVIQAIDTFSDISTTSYAASLVGKDVTIAASGTDGALNQVYGTITATGLYSGEQVIFVNDKSYKLSQIMAIGKLPETIKSDSSTKDDAIKETDEDI